MRPKTAHWITRHLFLQYLCRGRKKVATFAETFAEHGAMQIRASRAPPFITPASTKRPGNCTVFPPCRDFRGSLQETSSLLLLIYLMYLVVTCAMTEGQIYKSFCIARY